MTGKLQRRLWILLGTVAAACGAWWLLPGTALDRLAFTAVARGFANPPLFVSGQGGHQSPWTLRTFAAAQRADAREAPVVVSLGDDREAFFQSSPPSPIDLAVVLTNFQRLGVKKAATAVVLAWDTPDPIGLTALDKALGRFDTLVMAAPLTRGAVGEPLPESFRAASVAMAAVTGDVSALPVVNRIPVPGVILGGKNVLAGFQTLDSEPAGKFAPLLARWDDRVVLAFPLLCTLQRLDLPPGALIIRAGEAIQLGPEGPIIPIDRFGRLAVPLHATAPRVEIPAEAVVDGADGLLPHDAPGPVVLRDDRSSAEPATRAYSAMLPALIAMLGSKQTLAPAHDYHRPPARYELTALLLAAFILTALGGLPPFARHTAYLTTLLACLAAQCVAAGTAGWWLPGLAAMAAVFSAWLISSWLTIPAAAGRPATVEAVTAATPAVAPKAKRQATRKSVAPATPPAEPAPKTKSPRKSATKKPAPTAPAGPDQPAAADPAPAEPPKPVAAPSRATGGKSRASSKKRKRAL